MARNQNRESADEFSQNEGGDLPIHPTDEDKSYRNIPDYTKDVSRVLDGGSSPGHFPIPGGNGPLQNVVAGLEAYRKVSDRSRMKKADK